MRPVSAAGSRHMDRWRPRTGRAALSGSKSAWSFLVLAFLQDSTMTTNFGRFAGRRRGVRQGIASRKAKNQGTNPLQKCTWFHKMGFFASCFTRITWLNGSSGLGSGWLGGWVVCRQDAFYLMRLLPCCRERWMGSNGILSVLARRGLAIGRLSFPGLFSISPAQCWPRLGFILASKFMCG